MLAGVVVNNMAQFVQIDVRTAYIEVNRTREQVTATAATRTFQEEKLRQKPKSLRSENQPLYWWRKPNVILLPAAYRKLKPW